MAKSKDFFIWTDDEVELLLQVTREYKEAMAAENVDWETSVSKYGDVHERYRDVYPSPEQAQAMGKEYPHQKDEITKGQLTNKLKAIRFRYRQAVESGRLQGHGRVILLYFELCGAIWGGCLLIPRLSKDAKSAETQDQNLVVENRHQTNDVTLGAAKRKKLKRKFPVDPVAQEDVDIKRRLLQRLEATDAEFVQTMDRWSSALDRLNSNVELLVQHFMASGSSVGQQAVMKEKQCFDHSLNQNYQQPPLHFKEEETDIGLVADQHQESDRTNPKLPLSVQVKTEDTTYEHPISPSHSGQEEEEEEEEEDTFGPSTSIALEI